MKIFEIPVHDIVPYENNPRINDGAVDAVAESIERFGFNVPIVVDADNVIIAGHTRHKAAIKLGMETVPCIIPDLTEEQAKAFRLADNKVSEFSTWDADLLMQELEALCEMGVDMEDFGFSAMEKEAEALDLDEVPDKPEVSDKQQCHCPKCGFVFEV